MNYTCASAAPFPYRALSTHTIAQQVDAAGGHVEEIATADANGYRAWLPTESRFNVPDTSGLWIETPSAETWTPARSAGAPPPWQR